MQDQQVSIRVDRATRDRIEKLARARLDGIVVTISSVVRAALLAGLDELERQLREKAKGKR